MIRQKKSSSAPKSLARKKIYNDQDVQKQLIHDHHGKCYICDSKTYQNGQVEHLMGKATEDLEFGWHNLFWACGYCNNKKMESHYNIPYPPETDYLHAIKMQPDFINSTLNITIAKQINNIEIAIDLLQRVFNEHHKRARTPNGEQLWNRYMEEMIDFQKKVYSYKKEKSQTNKNNVINSLRIESEFLSSKYWFLSCTEEFDDFESHMHWNES